AYQHGTDRWVCEERGQPAYPRTRSRRVRLAYRTGPGPADAGENTPGAPLWAVAWPRCPGDERAPRLATAAPVAVGAARRRDVRGGQPQWPAVWAAGRQIPAAAHGTPAKRRRGPGACRVAPGSQRA